MVIYTVRSKEKYDGEGVLDVDEAFDGTWMTHGHKSTLELALLWKF